MKVFLCWSGDRSKAVAEALGHWIGQVIQAVEPWISTETDKGARWRQEVGDHLEEAKVGIVCLTPENLDSTWIHFEAGALSKTKDAKVCTFLLGMQHGDVKEPLAQFQHTKAEEEDIRALIQNINKYVAKDGERALPEKDVDEIFAVHWPRLKEKLDAISKQKVSEEPIRTDGDKLDEILEIVRGQERRVQQSESQGPIAFFTPAAGATPIFATGGPTGPVGSGSFPPLGEPVTFTAKPERFSIRTLKPLEDWKPRKPLEDFIKKEKEEDDTKKSKE